MKKKKSFKKVILGGILCLLASGSLFGWGWSNEDYNDELRKTPPVYFRAKDLIGTAWSAIYKNMDDVKIDEQPVLIEFSSRYQSGIFGSDFYPFQTERGTYKFVGLNKKGENDTIFIKSKSLKEPGVINFITDGHASTIVKAKSGDTYEIGFTYIVDPNAIWILHQPSSNGTDPASAYFVGIDYVKKVVEPLDKDTKPLGDITPAPGKDTKPLGDIKPVEEVSIISTQEELANDYLRTTGAVYLRAQRGEKGFDAIDPTGKEFSIGNRKVRLVFQNPENKDYVPATRFDPTQRYMFAGLYPSDGVGTIGIEIDGGKVEPVEIKKSGTTTNILTIDGKQYNVIVSSRLIEDKWMLYFDSKNQLGKAYLIGIDSINRIFPSQQNKR